VQDYSDDQPRDVLMSSDSDDPYQVGMSTNEGTLDDKFVTLNDNDQLYAEDAFS
jgi:hypothetical protein